MGNKYILPIIFVVCLLISACKAQTVPTVPTHTSTAEIPEPASTPTSSPFTINGEFNLTNTSTPVMDVTIERMAIVLEYRVSPGDPWENIVVDCSFDPPAPVVLKDELIVQYECQHMKQPPANVELQTTAEVKIYGSDEIFKLEVNVP